MANVYTVVMPFSGVAYREIVANSEEEAKKKFLDETTMSFGAPDGKFDAQVDGWQFSETIVDGNVFYGYQNECEVEDMGEAL